MDVKKWISRVLLAFVFVTIGFSLGRRTAPLPPSAVEQTVTASPSADAKVDKVVVYSAHMTFRCSECNQIEWFTKEVLENRFAEEVSSGKIDLQVVDYMKDPAFARRYDISSSTVVLSRVEDGQEKAFERLDGVWTKVQNRDEFMTYVEDAIRSQLKHLDGEEA